MCPSLTQLKSSCATKIIFSMPESSTQDVFVSPSALPVVASLLILGLSGATKKDTAGNLHPHNRLVFSAQIWILLHALIPDSSLSPPSFASCDLAKNNSGVKPAGQCGTWVKEPDGGIFTSPNYPNKYPPDTECVYILEGKYSIEAV